MVLQDTAIGRRSGDDSMGRKSREKRERRVHAAEFLPADSDAFSAAPTPDVVYRFFDEPQYAEALVNGYVWLSTLETCRSYEDPARGDRGEGTLAYRSGYIRGDGTDPSVQEVGRRAGIRIDSTSKNIILSDNAML